MKLINAYLAFSGNCEEAIGFYADCLNGKIESVLHYEGTPMETPEDRKKVMHSVLTFGSGNTIMACDGNHHYSVQTGNNVSLCAHYEDAAAMENAFNKLSDGGNVLMPLQDTFWGARHGMLTDKFGINWMFNQQIDNM